MDDLIIYSSTDGQTKKICEKIIKNLPSGNKFKLVSLDEALYFNLEKCEKIIIGASIRYGRHNKKVLDFIIKNKSILDLKKTAFFSVNVVARKEEKSTPETNPYVLSFLKKTNWKPNKLSVFADFRRFSNNLGLKSSNT